MQKFSSQFEFLKKKTLKGFPYLNYFLPMDIVWGCNYQEHRVVEDKQNMKKIYMEIKMSV